MTSVERKERMLHFPKDGNELIVQILAKSHGESPLKAKTVGAILRGERTDNHGVIDIFISMTDTIKRRKEQAIEQALNQESHA
jgi:hypothetical protein